MKPNIHPAWYPEAVVTCACGNTWTTGSTKKEIHTDVCSKCHPFFTGEQRIVDTAGQVERFMKRISAKEQIAASQPGLEEKKSKKEKRRGRKAAVEPEAEAPQPPAELPLAVAEERPAPPTRAPRARRPAAPEPGVEEVAPIVEPEQFQAGKNEEIAPAGEIGQVASIDKIVEPTGELGSETQAESGESPEPEEAPRGTESSDHVHDVEKPGEGGA